jgi:hypothetical protein
MDAKKLVGGQDVHIVSGPYFWRGKVVKVTPEGVEVQTREELLPSGDLNLRCGMEQRLHFDNNGKGRAAEGTYECGAWQLVDKLFSIGSCTYTPIEGSAVAASVISFEKEPGLVGQKVRLSCDNYCTWGVVTRITIRGMDVEIQFPGSCLLHFDHFGRCCDDNEIEGPRIWYIVGGR